ncbi:MAG: PDZ domain-containing protein [bacterium]
MKSRMLFVLFAIFLPLALVGTACAFKGGEKKSRGTIAFVDSREGGWLGVSIEDVTPKLARRKNLNVEEGAYVNNIEPASPADQVGIVEGDVIVEFDGKKVRDSGDLIEAVRKTKPATEVPVVVLHDGEKRTLKPTIAKAQRAPKVFSFSHPIPPHMPIAPRMLMWGRMIYGLSLEDMNKQLAEYFNAPNGKGVLVKSVESSSEAEKAGFKAGDVIVRVGKETIAAVDDIYDVLDGYKEGDKAEFEILRKDATQKLSLAINDKEEGLSFRKFRGDDDELIELRKEGLHFRHESNRLKLELERMKDSIHDRMIELKNKLKYEFNRIRVSVSA